jgi:hypothetical protein
MCMTVFFPIHIDRRIDHQGELPFVFSVTLMFMYKHDDRDLGQTSDRVHMSLWIVTARKIWMSHDRMLWVHVNAHWNTKLVFNPMPVHSGMVMCCCYPALTWVSMVYLGDKQMIWVWCKVPMNTALLALETRVDAFLLWFGSVYETVYLYMNTYKTCWSMDAYGISELL